MSAPTAALLTKFPIRVDGAVYDAHLSSRRRAPDRIGWTVYVHPRPDLPPLRRSDADFVTSGPHAEDAANVYASARLAALVQIFDRPELARTIPA